MELRGDVGYVECRFSLFGDSVILPQDRRTVSTKCIGDSEIVLDEPDGTPT
jgi:hypothetical protein